MSDVSHLFPQLAQQLNDWDGRNTQVDDGSTDPNHAGVTDQQIDDYLRSIGSLRAPLSPVISGQQPPPTPEFRAGAGRTVPPGESYMEPPQAAEPTAETQYQQPEPPAPPEPEPTAEPDYYDIGGRRYDRKQAEAWAQFDQMVTADPQLAQVIRNYLTTRQAPPPPPPPIPDLPPAADIRIGEEYADDETIQALYRGYQAQQEAIDRISHQAAAAERLATQQMQRTYTDIAQGAVTEFQRSHSLDDATMEAVARSARASGFAEKYMQGVDPLTGLPVAPDPYRAAMSALNAGYMMAPETRELDIQNAIQARAARFQQEQTRKQKLAGISGASGSVPRTQSIPSNPQDARAAMTEEVSQMLQGAWVGDGS